MDNHNSLDLQRLNPYKNNWLNQWPSGTAAIWVQDQNPEAVTRSQGDPENDSTHGGEGCLSSNNLSIYSVYIYIKDDFIVSSNNI